LVEVGFLQIGYVTLTAHFRWMGISAPAVVSIRKLEWLLFYMVSKCWQNVLSFRHKERVWHTLRIIASTNTMLS